jgi:glycosyltransferase involved in cell wall biosynthesis
MGRHRVTVLTGIFPPDIGGPATSVPALARYLAEAGRPVTVVTLADRPVSSASDPCRVVRIRRGSPMMQRVWAVRKALLETTPDVVLANGLHLEATLALHVPVVQKIVGDWAWEKARNRGWTFVGVDAFEQAPLAMKARTVRRLRGAVTRRAQMVIAPSRYVAGLVRSWGVDDERIRVVPNAAPLPTPSSAERSQRGLFAGRLVPWKHLDHAIRVVARLPGLGLDVVGTGPVLEDLKYLSRSLKVERRVVFHGLLTRDSVLEMMRKAGFLVLSSSYEGMPHVVLEAFAVGLPVVAADAAGIPEIVEDRVSGLIYPWGSLDALEDALRTVSRPEVASRLAAGGLAVAERLALEPSARATIEVLDEALACA